MAGTTRVRVAVNGYGVIGKRVADAVALQEDMSLVGVACAEGIRAVRGGRSLVGERIARSDRWCRRNASPPT